jgi:hypothetical protein
MAGSHVDDRTAHGVAAWSSPSWLAGAVSWLDSRLMAAGIERIGEVTQPHLRPWATVLSAPTSRGQVWLKAPGPGTRYEVPLYQLLARVVPDRILRPIAVDVDRGWVLLSDGGARLLDVRGRADFGDLLVSAFQHYGQLQRELAPSVPELLAAGVADMRAEVMPARFEEAADAARRRHGAGDHFERALAMRDTFRSWCRDLAAGAVAPSLDHNDLHLGNMLTGSPDGRARFYDWGDCVVAHPFASMLVGLGMLPYFLEVAVDDPILDHLRDAYLEVFTDLAPRAELVAELELACRVAKIARVLTWERALQAQGDEETDYADAPLRTFLSILARSHLATDLET